MKKFSFKLESLLSLREGIEKQWENKLTYANGQIAKINNDIKSLELSEKNSKLEGIDPGNFLIQSYYQQGLRKKIEEKKIELGKKTEEMEELKKIYIQKSIDRKIIDKIKDKQVTAYHKESIKNENKVIDEINNSAKIREAILGGVI